MTAIQKLLKPCPFCARTFDSMSLHSPAFGHSVVKCRCGASLRVDWNEVSVKRDPKWSASRYFREVEKRALGYAVECWNTRPKETT